MNSLAARRTTRWIAGAVLAGASLWMVTANVIFGDEGLYLVTYAQYARSSATVVRATASFWLTNVIGALWLAASPLPGIATMRLGALLAYAACGVIAWRLAVRAGREVAGWTAALTIGVALASGYVYLEYTVLTALALTTTAGLLFIGTRRQATAPLVAAGVVIGLGIFLRAPNVAMVTLVFAPAVLAWTDRSLPSRRVRACLLVAIGVVAGVSLVGVMMLARHETAAVVLAVRDLMHTPPTAHSPARLLRDAARTAVLSGVQGAACWGLLGVVSSLEVARPWRLVGGIAAVAALALAHLLVPRIDWSYTVVGLSVLGSLLAIVDSSTRPDARCLAVLGLWVVLLIGAGSASLPWPLLVGLWLAFPSAMSVFADPPVGAFPRLANRRHGRLLLAASVTIAATHVIPLTPYAEAAIGRRPAILPQELSVVPRDRRLWPIHTSSAVATATDDLLGVLPRFVHPGDPLIASNGIPLVTYLAGATPFLAHPYPDIAGVAGLEQDLTSTNWQGAWPVWIRARFMPAADFAISAAAGSTFGETAATRETLDAFLRARGYRVAWTNALFEISTPPPDHARAR